MEDTAARVEGVVVDEEVERQRGEEEGGGEGRGKSVLEGPRLMIKGRGIQAKGWTSSAGGTEAVERRTWASQEVGEGLRGQEIKDRVKRTSLAQSLWAVGEGEEGRMEDCAVQCKWGFRRECLMHTLC